MASKSRSNLSGTPNKAMPATSRVSKLSKRVSKAESETQATPGVSKLGKRVSKAESESPLPLRNSHSSIDRSLRSVNSEPTVGRKSPKSSTLDKQPRRVAKVSELQTQLNIAQEDLKKAKEQLNQAEKEKAKAIDELREAHKAAEEADEKLTEALIDQKRAQENPEIEKFQTFVLEQARIEDANKKEEEWQKEIESIRNQHALDVAALLSTTQELQRVKQELAMTCDAKKRALGHADDATKIAELHVEKSDTLSAELARLKALLDSKLETEACENKIVLKLKTEIHTLRQELDEGKAYQEKSKGCEEKAKAREDMAKDYVQKVKGYEERLVEKDTFIEQLKVDLEAAKMAESYAQSLLEKCQKRVGELEISVEEANKLKKSASESLESVMKQLEGNNDLLHDAESEIAPLKEKLGLLEMTITKQGGDLEDSERHILIAKEVSTEMSKKIDSLRAELETIKQEKAQALNNEKLAASSVQTLLEEKNKLINELETSQDEEEKSTKAMESLASALHEVSAEAREAKEKLLTYQAEHEIYDQMEDLKSVLKATNEKYESMLADARHQLDNLKCIVENSKNDLETSKGEWEQREHNLVNCIKQSEEENSSLVKEINRLVNLLRQAEEKSCTQKKEEALLKENLKEVEAEVIHLQESLKETKVDSMRLKETFLSKEKELQSIVQENEELRTREADSIKKVEELSKLFEEAKTRTQTEENVDLTDSEKEYDFLPKVVEFSEEKGHKGEDMSKFEVSSNRYGLRQNLQEEGILFNDKAGKKESPIVENANRKFKEDGNKTKEKDDSVELEFKVWEGCNIEKKEFSPEREAESKSFEEEVDLKIEGSEGSNQINGFSSMENIDDGGKSPTKQQMKKKKPLLGKFGSLLKKRGGSNQKRKN